MRTITGTLRPTPLPRLSVLSNIAPPHLRREEVTASMVENIRVNPSLPLYHDMFQPPRARLTSRQPVWSSLPNQKPLVTEAWQEEWTNAVARNQFLIVNAAARVLGSDLPRRLWSLLNRFRTGQGICAANLHLGGLRADPLC